jgi:putative FmdB family regulatory protein
MYVYACEPCGHGFEIRQRFDDQPLSVCPECGGKIRRVIQPVGIVFKGTGFYKTDNRGPNGNTLPAGERVAAATPAATGNGTTADTAPSSNGAPAAPSAPAAPAASTESKVATAAS